MDNEQNNALAITSSAGDIHTPRPRRNKLNTEYQQTDFWKNLDREGLIRMKPGNAGTGAGEAVRRLAAAMLIKYPTQGYNAAANSHSTLIRQNDGSCLLEDAKSKMTKPPVDGQKYIFVTMPDGAIRVGPKATAGNGHAQISGYAAYVKFAGEVIFENGKEARATPQSGTYLPPLENAAALSGLNCKFTENFEEADTPRPATTR